MQCSEINTWTISVLDEVQVYVIIIVCNIEACDNYFHLTVLMF